MLVGYEDRQQTITAGCIHSKHKLHFLTMEASFVHCRSKFKHIWPKGYYALTILKKMVNYYTYKLVGKRPFCGKSASHWLKGLLKLRLLHPDRLFGE